MADIRLSNWDIYIYIYISIVLLFFSVTGIFFGNCSTLWEKLMLGKGLTIGCGNITLEEDKNNDIHNNSADCISFLRKISLFHL